MRKGRGRFEERDDPKIMNPPDAIIHTAVGSDVASVKPGQFVIGSFVTSDNTCAHCRRHVAGGVKDSSSRHLRVRLGSMALPRRGPVNPGPGQSLKCAEGVPPSPRHRQEILRAAEVHPRRPARRLAAAHRGW